MASHGYDDDDFDIVDANEWNQYDSYAMRRAPQHTQIHMTQQMTTKVAPAYDGRTSFFAFEDAIDDWCDITELEPEKRGPALRNRLEGDAQQYKRLLDRELLRDPYEGVAYFKRFLRPHFIKGAQNVFLYRFMQFMKFNRGTMDLQKWMTRFQLTGNRLIESWMDLLPEVTVTSPEAILFVQQRRQEHERDQQERAEVAAASGTPHVAVPWTDELALAAFRQFQENRREAQRQAFPLGENLLALIFVSLADLSQDQRNTLTSIMTHRGRTLDRYSIQELRDLFLEMFCTTKTAVDNPLMQPSGMAQRRSFLVLDEGELEGTDGYWAEDEEDGAEGFLDALEDVFWVYDDANFTWYQRRFQGKYIRRGKGKGKRKGKGKGRGGRRFFKSRKGKGRGKGRRKGRAHMVSEEGYEDEWQEDEWNENYDGYWADDQTWNEGYWAYDDLYYMDEYGYFQKKGKGKGKGKKGKKGKDDDGKGGKPGDGKGKSNYVQPQTTSAPAIQNQPTQQAHYSSAASSSGHGFFSFGTTEPARVDVAETEPARVDVLTSTYAAQDEQRRTRRGGQNQRDARAHQNRREMKRFPVLVGEVGALRQGVQQRPAVVPRQVGLQEGEASWKPLAEGTSLFSHGCSTEIEEPSQQSAFSFHTVQTDLACENGLAFHTENSAPPTVCILDLGCTRAMGSRRAVEAFCRYVDSHPNSGLWYEIQPTSSRFFFANSQQSKCTEKLVIFMYDHGWNTQFTEFDIVEEGDVPLLMSLPQMRNLGFQFELTPEKAYLSCARIGMRKMVLRTAISTHLILDLQDVAWYMSQVHFKTPQVKSFYSQHDHFEYSQIAVKQDDHEGEALVTGDYWQVDPLRRELIRHHKDKRMNLHEMTRSEKTPIPKDQLLDERETHMEFQKSKKKVLHKDNWRTEKKRFSEQSEEFWKGKTIYKIKEDYVIPDDIVRSDIDRAKPFRGNIDDLFHPESASSVPSGVQKKKPSSLKKEEGKPISNGPGSKKIEVGPPAAKRHVGKQKPQVVDDSQSGSSRKKVVVSYPKLDEEDELDKVARELGLDKIDSDEPQVIEPKHSAPARNRGKQDSESQVEKLGSDALEPRRVSIPLPGSEVQAMTPAYRKMLRKLEDSVELYKLHIKHYHMSPTQFRRRTSMLGLPDSVYQKYEEMYNKCRVCSTSIAPPPRARISGIRSTNFGDVIFVDHAEIQLRKNKYMVLLVLDGATNLLWATAQNSLNNKETIQALRLWSDEHNCMPKAIVGDEAFFQEDFLTYYRTHGIKECPCGSRTPWPNRAESAVRLFKRQWQIMSKNLEDDRFKGITIREAVKRTVWARNTQLTVSGYSPLEIATGRRPPDLLDIETSDPAQLSVDPLPEDKTQLELQRLALRAHQEARQAADLRHDMAKRTMPSDGPYKPGDKVFVWSSPVNANAIASKAWKKERWIRGTVISQEGAMVNVHVDNAVMRVNQSKVRRDHDEWHDVAVPGLDTSEPVPLAVEDEDDYEPDIAEYAEAYLGEQAHWFCQTGKCDVVELFSSNTGLSWHMARLNMKVGEPIDHKHGWSFNSKKKQNQVWKQLEKLDPEYVLITNPSPNSWKYSVFKFCLDVMKWQADRGKGFLVIAPPDSGFAQFLAWKKFQKDRIKYHIGCFNLDMTNYCRCDPSIKNLRVYYNHDEDFDMLEPQHAFNREGKLWNDPQWKVLPSHLCSFIAQFTQLVPLQNMRQCFLFEDLLEHFDDGALCGTSMFLDREPECSCLLQDLHHVETSIPVPLKHILPQRFTTQLLVQTLRKIDQLPRSTEASVRESTDPRIIELIPGLQDVRKKTLPQMYFEDCSVFRGTYGRVNPLFQHPEDAVLLIWKPGDYDHVYFMFVSQLYPHHEQFKIHEWSMIVFSRETTGAIKRRVEDPPSSSSTPPNGDDPIHPDQHGDVPPNDDEMLSGDEPEDPLDDDNQPDYNTGPDPGDDDDQEYIIPDDYGPPPDDDLDMPGIQDSGETHQPSSPSTPFSNPDIPIEEIADPGQDDDSPPGPDPTSEPIRVQRKQRQISTDSTDALPKAKAKVIIKRPKVQLPGHVQPISVPTQKPYEDEDEGPSHDPTASSSHDNTIPLPTTTPTSFTPGDFAQPAQQQSSQGTPELVSSQHDDDETEPYETDDTPVLTEDDIAQLQEEDVDTEPYTSDHSHFVDVDGTVFVPLGPKVQAAPEFGSYDVTGFKQFEQYLAKNGKKQPKAESVITQEVLRKYAKEIKQAKLEEFRSFLDFTAMTFRDKRRHKIDNYVTGRWVLTIKVDKDGQFKKFKARWVCRGFQDAQKYDLQTDSPTATRYGFRVASQHAASMYWDLLHLDLKTAFLQGETYDLDRRVIHVQLPTDIGLPPYLVGLCTRSVYGLADAPRRWWNRLDKFLISLGIQPTRADRCTYVCYDGAFKEPKQVSFADSEATEPAPVTYYVSSQDSEETRDESSDIAEEVHKSLLVEERLFSACYQQTQTWKQRKEFKEKKVEDCAWTPVVDETLLKFLESVEHKSGWYPFENGHAQVAYRAKALRTPDSHYDRKKFHLRTSIVKRKGVWWLLEMNHDMNKDNVSSTYLATTPQLTPEIVEQLLEHFMDPVNGSNAKGRKPIGMCCLHVDDLFITGTPRSFWRSSRKLSSHNSRLVMKM